MGRSILSRLWRSRSYALRPSDSPLPDIPWVGASPLKYTAWRRKASSGSRFLNTGSFARPAGEAGEEEARKRAELVALAKSQGMPAMLRQWLPPMIDSRRIHDTALGNAIIAMMSRKTPEIFAAQVKALLGRPDASAVLEQIRCPALLLTGREDGWSGPAQHSAMAAKIAASQLVIVPDCGHMSMLERPAEVSAALRTWLLRA